MKRALATVAATALLACTKPTEPTEQDASPRTTDAADAAPPPDAAARPTTARPQLDGHAFPDGVLALTWDDGPDIFTIELATFLQRQHVHATFFVVQEWIDGVSSDPGRGAATYATGYAKLPVLGQLVALGHRIGNHTAHHVLLPSANDETIARELADNQAAIAPFVGDGLRLYRVPGGAWDAHTTSVVDGDPRLAGLTGPVRWDVDRKDWDNSLACDSTAPATECEALPDTHERRTKPEVIARRYLASIAEAGHGIVLLHDRVGDVGSRYALRLAKVLVPELVKRGYVFAAPVLAFSPLEARRGWEGVMRFGGLDLRGDVNGDGRDDRCFRDGDSIRCALGNAHGFTGDSVWASGPAVARATDAGFGDLDGDGRMDICLREPDGVVCGLAP